VLHLLKYWAVLLSGIELYYTWRRIAIAEEDLKATQENLKVAQENLKVSQESQIT
jgi:hypothetical protein